MSSPLIQPTPRTDSDRREDHALAERVALAVRNSRPVAPPTVYRALDFLMSQGLVSKIESHNAYVLCASCIAANPA